MNSINCLSWLFCCCSLADLGVVVQPLPARPVNKLQNVALRQFAAALRVARHKVLQLEVNLKQPCLPQPKDSIFLRDTPHKLVKTVNRKITLIMLDKMLQALNAATHKTTGQNNRVGVAAPKFKRFAFLMIRLRKARDEIVLAIDHGAYENWSEAFAKARPIPTDTFSLFKMRSDVYVYVCV